MTQPEIRWVERRFGDGLMFQAEHDGPCVFIDGQCSCGILDLGIVREDATRPQPGQSASPPRAGDNPQIDP